MIGRQQPVLAALLGAGHQGERPSGPLKAASSEVRLVRDQRVEALVRVLVNHLAPSAASRWEPCTFIALWPDSEPVSGAYLQLATGRGRPGAARFDPLHLTLCGARPWQASQGECPERTKGVEGQPATAGETTRRRAPKWSRSRTMPARPRLELDEGHSGRGAGARATSRQAPIAGRCRSREQKSRS